MRKDKYFVTVETGEILRDPQGNYQFVIEANDQERRELEELFDLAREKEMDTALPAITPGAYHLDEDNHEYDAALKEIYKKLHQLGVDETRQHIESMNIL